MSGEQAIFNLQIKKKSGLSVNPDIHHSKVFSSSIALNIHVSYFENWLFLFVVSLLKRLMRFNYLRNDGGMKVSKDIGHATL